MLAEVKLTLALLNLPLTFEELNTEFALSLEVTKQWPQHKLTKQTTNSASFVGDCLVYQMSGHNRLYIWLCEDHWLLSPSYIKRKTQQGDGFATFCQALKEVLALD